MGLLSKLKNVLFEIEEEDEEVVAEETVTTETKKVEEPKDDYLSDRELFKAEPTFNFPNFDETEFDKNRKINLDDTMFPSDSTPKVQKREKIEPKYEQRREETRNTQKRNDVRKSEIFDFERIDRNKKTTKKTQPTKVRTIQPENEKKKFIPSPVISPVYGILDKNYRKEDVVVKKDSEKPKINVDVVRKKAFGTLEEDIEKTLTNIIPKKEEKKVLNETEDNEILDLLKKSVDDTIEIPEIGPTIETNSEDDSFNIEDILEQEMYDDENVLNEVLCDDFEDTIETPLFDRKDVSKTEIVEDYETDDYFNEPEMETQPTRLDSNKKELSLEDDTLENDLFDLIDSMYENREED